MGISRSADETLRATLDAIQHGCSVEIQGIPGSGRSWILEEARAQLAMGSIEVLEFPGVSIPIPPPATPPSISIASGGLDDAGLQAENNPRTAAATLTQYLTTTPSVLLLDDADYLEPSAIWAILMSQARTKTPSIGTVRLRGLSEAGFLTGNVKPSIRLVVQPWRPSEIDSLLREKLGLGLEARSLGEIFNSCGGIPGLTLEVVRSLLQRGLLHRSDIGSGLTQDIWSPELSPLLEDFLIGLDETALTALHALSVAGTLNIPAARSMPWASALPILETRGLIHLLDVDSRQELVVYPPLLADYFRDQFGRWLYNDVEHSLGLLASETAKQAPKKTIITYSTREAALLSTRAHDIWRNAAAIRREAWLEDSSAWNTLRYLVALGHISAPSSLVNEVVSTSDLHGEASDRALLYTWRATYLSIVRNSPESGLARLEEARALLPGFDGAMRASEAHIRLAFYGVPDPALLAPPTPTKTRCLLTSCAFSPRKPTSRPDRKSEPSRFSTNTRPSPLSA